MLTVTSGVQVKKIEDIINVNRKYNSAVHSAMVLSLELFFVVVVFNALVFGNESILN